MARLEYPNIEAERVRRQMSKEEFASALGVNVRTVRNWQNGLTEIPLCKIRIMRELFGVSADYLISQEVKT